MRLARLGLIVAIAAIFGACTDEKIVFVEREPFNPPVDSLNGFLGYFDAATKRTACGNCHVSHQRDWVATAHADAWAGLQSSANAQAFCEGCHTVSERGNPTLAPAGYNAIADSAYHDVQCESCHGPGFTHASVPDVGTPPLARLAAALDDTSGTCGDCHSGSHHPFVEEWAQSRHAQVITFAATRDGCNACHEARGTLRAWGVDARYIESNDVVTAANALPTTCAVCHDPHGSANPAQLRWPLETLDAEQNLCMKCHLRRTVPQASSSRGNTPHGPQGAVVLGEAGYQNPAYLDTLLLNQSRLATHADLTRNPRLCAGCHLFAFNTTDSDGNSFSVTGHLFRPIPCYGPNGLPTDTITNCAYTPAERSFRSCAVSGCHATENQAALALGVTRQRMQDLSRTMWRDVNGNRTIDAFPTDSGFLPRIRANTTDLNPSDAIITAADGAEFNLRLVGEDATGFLYGNGDKSHAAHNPFIAEAILRASINELMDIYTGQPWFSPPSPAVMQILSGPMVSGNKPFPGPVRRVSSR